MVKPDINKFLKTLCESMAFFVAQKEGDKWITKRDISNC